MIFKKRTQHYYIYQIVWTKQRTLTKSGGLLYLYTMTPHLKRFIELKKSDVLNIVRGYVLMRKMFIDNGVKDRQLLKGEGMTREMYIQREKIIYDLQKLKSEARRFGLIENQGTEFDDYFSELLGRIDDKTPL